MTNRQGATPKILAESVYKSYSIDGKREQVLDGVGLSVGSGEFVSIIGPSGCGKSTLLNIIAGLDEPDAGTLGLDGDPAQKRLGSIG